MSNLELEIDKPNYIAPRKPGGVIIVHCLTHSEREDILRQAASDTGVELDIVATEEQSYRYIWRTKTGQRCLSYVLKKPRYITEKGTVPSGYSLMRLRRFGSDLSDFWRKVDQLNESRFQHLPNYFNNPKLQDTIRSLRILQGSLEQK